MKTRSLITGIILIISLAACGNNIFLPEGRWNPNDPEYDAATDPSLDPGGPPAVPGRLSAILSESAVSAALEWQDNSTTEDGFNIYRKKSDDVDWIKIANVSTDVTSYTDQSAFSLGAKYQYRVKSINENGESDFSNAAEIDVPSNIITVTVSSTAAPSTNTSPVPVTITFSEEVTGFEQSDISITNASITSFDIASNPVFSLELTPDNPGTDCLISLSVPEGAAENASGTTTQPSDTFAIIYDVTAPGAPGAPALAAADDSGELDNDGLTNKDSNITLTGITAADTSTVIIMDSTDTTELGAASSAPGETYSILIGSLSEGENVFHAYGEDAAGNRSSAYSSCTVTVDTAPPGPPSFTAPYRGEYFPHTTGFLTITPAWKTTDADIWKYNLKYGTSRYFSGATEVNDITSTSYYFAPGSNFVHAKMYFAVQAVDSAGNSSDWSNFDKNNPDTTYCHFDKEHDSVFGDEFAGFLSSYGNAFRYYYSDYSTGDIVSEPVASPGENAELIGDFNGDGYPDLAVANLSSHHVYIYLGVAEGTLDWGSEYSIDIDGSGWYSEGEKFGQSMDGCDINGDGYDDLIIGAPEYHVNNYGAVFIVNGRILSEPTIDLPTIQLTHSTTELYGYSVSRAGDINNDGFADIIIGAPAADGGNGRAYIRLGGPNAPYTFNEYILYAPEAGMEFGTVTSFGGDIDNDGYDDFLIGTARMVGGEGYLYYGNEIGAIAEPDETWSTSGDTFYGIAGGSSFDNDADNADVVVSLFNGTSGELQVFFSGGIDGSPDYTINSSTTDHGGIGIDFGTGLCELKDINGNGHCEIIINEPLYDNGTALGRVWIEDGRGASGPWSTLYDTIEADSAGKDIGQIIN